MSFNGLWINGWEGYWLGSTTPVSGAQLAANAVARVAATANLSIDKVLASDLLVQGTATADLFAGTTSVDLSASAKAVAMLLLIIEEQNQQIYGRGGAGYDKRQQDAIAWRDEVDVDTVIAQWELLNARLKVQSGQPKSEVPNEKTVLKVQVISPEAVMHEIDVRRQRDEEALILSLLELV